MVMNQEQPKFKEPEGRFEEPEEKFIEPEEVWAPTQPTDLDNEVFEYQNIARQHPEYIVDKLKRLQEKMPDKYSAAEIKEALYDMSIRKPLEPLVWSKELFKVCVDHMMDLGPKGIVSDKGSNGSTIYERVNKRVKARGICGENIQVGASESKEIIMDLIIDSKNNMKSHRRTLMESKFTKGAACTGPHSTYEVWTVFVYSE